MAVERAPGTGCLEYLSSYYFLFSCAVASSLRRAPSDIRVSRDGERQEIPETLVWRPVEVSVRSPNAALSSVLCRNVPERTGTGGEFDEWNRPSVGHRVGDKAIRGVLQRVQSGRVQAQQGHRVSPIVQRGQNLFENCCSSSSTEWMTQEVRQRPECSIFSSET